MTTHHALEKTRSGRVSKRTKTKTTPKSKAKNETIGEHVYALSVQLLILLLFCKGKPTQNRGEILSLEKLIESWLPLVRDIDGHSYIDPDQFCKHLQATATIAAAVAAAAAGAVVAVQEQVRKPSRNYLQVRCLLLDWEDDDLGCRREINELEQVFRDRFDYSVENWRIPSQNPKSQLLSKLQDFVAKGPTENELLIVYYGGHGGSTRDGELRWVANRKSGSARLHWSSLQNSVLMPLERDVLIILDCCAAGCAFREDLIGRKDIIAACPWDSKACGDIDAKTTFTQAMIDELKKFKEPFTPADLLAKLVTRKQKSPGGRLEYMPCHVSHRGRDNHQIKLEPIKLEPDVSDSIVRDSVKVEVSFWPPPSMEKLSKALSKILPAALGSISVEKRHGSGTDSMLRPHPILLAIPRALWQLLPQRLQAFLRRDVAY